MTTDSAVDPYESGDIVNSDGSKPRDLNLLLKMDSYQQMTDDEIRLVMAWKEMIAAREARTAAMAEAYKTAYDEFRVSIARALDSAESNFQTACSLVPDFKKTGGEAS